MRHGFYWATAFVILIVEGLIISVPESARADGSAWVPAILAVNLQVTTFFFVAGLLLLERGEGTLAALAVSPISPGGYLAVRTCTLTFVGALETIAVVWIGFGAREPWLHILVGTMALGVIYTGFGVAVAARYESVNALLLPASSVVTLLLLPLLPHFGLAPRLPFLLQPIEPALALMRTGYTPDPSNRKGIAGCPPGKMSRATIAENAMSVAQGIAQPRIRTGGPK
jgi:fluoroquinolone transport system permease protein